jgi:hypothetical protein
VLLINEEYMGVEWGEMGVEVGSGERYILDRLCLWLCKVAFEAGRCINVCSHNIDGIVSPL